MFSVIDKVVLITGAANGIGAQTVKEFLKEGAKYIAILDIDEPAGNKLETEIALERGQNKANYFKCDVTNKSEMLGIYDKIIEEQGVIDVVVNNAGIATETLDTYEKEIEINFTAVITSSLKALEHMRADRGGKGGTIINISSIAVLSQNLSPYHIYAATKNAVLTFSNRIGLDKYYSQTKVRVITICFGVTDTQMLQTCKGFDISSDEKDESMNVLKKITIQTSEVAAKGVVEGYKNGSSGSTWLINNGQYVDITEKIKEADEILCSLIF